MRDNLQAGQHWWAIVDGEREMIRLREPADDRPPGVRFYFARFFVEGFHPLYEDEVVLLDLIDLPPVDSRYTEDGPRGH